MRRYNPIVLITILQLAVAQNSIAGRTLIAGSTDGKTWGYIGKDGKYIIQPAFEAAYAFNENHAVVKQKGKWGVIDTLGNFTIAPVYDDTQGLVHEGKITFKKSKAWGVIDLTGKVVVAFSYPYLSIFNEGMIVAARPASTKGMPKGTMDVAVMDKNGRIMLDYGSYYLPGSITEGKKWTLGKWPVVRDGWISLLYTGAFSIDVIREWDPASHYIVAHHVASGLPLSNYLLTLKKGQHIDHLPHFINGMALVSEGDVAADATIVSSWDKETRYYFGDVIVYNGLEYTSLLEDNVNQTPSLDVAWRQTGREVNGKKLLSVYSNVPAPVYEVMTYSDGMGEWQSGVDYFQGDVVTYDDQLYEASVDHLSESWNRPQGYSNDQWHRVTRDRTSDTLAMRQNVRCEKLSISGEDHFAFHEGHALIRCSDGFKIIEKGRWIYETNIDVTKYTLRNAIVSEGLIAAMETKTGKWGYVDINGKTATAFTFERAQPFTQGIAIASVNGKSGIIDRQGNWLVQPAFHSLQIDETTGEELHGH